MEDINLLQKKLDIAINTLEQYANKKNWRDSVTELNTDFFEYENSMYKMKSNGFEEAQVALKQIREDKNDN